MAADSNQQFSVSRRQTTRLALGIALLLAGCRSTSQVSELDRAAQDLQALLDDNGEIAGRDDLAAIASRIRLKLGELVDLHQGFTDEFDRGLVDYATSQDQLKQIAVTYGRRRRSLRNDLLFLQDELRQAVNEEEWRSIVEILNQASDTISAYSFSGT